MSTADARPMSTQLTKEELRARINASTEDYQHLLTTDDSAPALRLTQDQPDKPIQEPTDDRAVAPSPNAMPGWLRAFSTAIVGPLTASASERQRANHIASQASSMATQMLMPAITEDDQPTPEEQIAAVVEELAALLRDQASGDPDPGRVYVTMAALEAIRPGVLAELSDDHAGELGAILSPAEIEAVRAARTLAAGLAETDDANDPNALASLLDEVAAELRPHTDARIGETKLCRRVVGYGQYTPLASNTFVAGRASRVIVYTELDRFAHRPVSARDNVNTGDEWAIEVAQSLSLFVARGDRQPVWHEPEQRVLQTSRRRIRDLYLVQVITIPANLGVGSFNLRVRVRDIAGSSLDERLIPIRIVADPVLAHSSAR